ncbi:unnamed protein product [Allacma fusca]|uniref:Uncharacterized protein n=1 Tax=Allacma fusca TaxID=39272 RepID=A0A8J2KQ17_9HEXA|nr:unnamed protein product [Allacma fusca]
MGESIFHGFGSALCGGMNVANVVFYGIPQQKLKNGFGKRLNTDGTTNAFENQGLSPLARELSELKNWNKNRKILEMFPRKDEGALPGWQRLEEAKKRDEIGLKPEKKNHEA